MRPDKRAQDALRKAHSNPDNPYKTITERIAEDEKARQLTIDTESTARDTPH